MAATGGLTNAGSVLVTGAGGFIGSELVRYLVDSGCSVIATARRGTDTLSSEFGFEVRPLDVLGDLSVADAAFAEAETLVHCATANDVASKAEDGGMALGVAGTYRLVEHAARHGIRRVVFLSTFQVYGTELNGEICEDTAARCESAYGLNHQLGEEVCRLAARRHGMDVVMVRPANVYGVPAVSTVNRSTLVPACFVEQAALDGAITLRSSGLQTRNFVSTQEVAEVIGKLIASFPRSVTVVNAVSAWHASILDIALMVQAVWQQELQEHVPLNILSPEPTVGNRFSVGSGVVPPRLTMNQSQARMEEVVRNLIRSHRRVQERRVQ